MSEQNQKKVPLSDRMKAAFDLVSTCECAADIGCDHGYLPIALCLSGKARRAIAMDINEGPLKRASENISGFDLTDRIETRLSDGLARLSEGEADTVIITGMGGKLIAKILGDHIGLTQTVKQLILGPQSDIPYLRSYLYAHGFRIVNEKMVLDEGKYYQLIAAVPEISVDMLTKLSDEELVCGPILLRQQDPILLKWIKKEIKTRNDILLQLERTDSEQASARKKELEKEQSIFRSALEYSLK